MKKKTNNNRLKQLSHRLARFCVPWGIETYCIGDPPGYGANPNVDLTSLGGILTSLMPYIFAISGIILLFMIIASGYSLLTSAGNPESIEKGKKRLTAALTGFLIIFAAFWIWQLIQVFLGTAFQP